MNKKHSLDAALDRLSLEGRKEHPPDPYRISGCGKCVRYLGYVLAGYEPLPLEPRGARVFRLGDILHEEIQETLGQAGLASRFEEVVSLRVPLLREKKGEYVELRGHIDGVYHDPEQGDKLLEIKTTTDYGFNEVRRTQGGSIDETYLCQNVGYQFATGLDGVWCYYNKNTSALYSFYADKQLNKPYFQRIQDRYTKLELFRDSGAEEPPESLREHAPEPETYRRKPTGKMKLPWQCSYCKMNGHCWPGAKLEITRGKPVYYV